MGHAAGDFKGPYSLLRTIIMYGSRLMTKIPMRRRRKRTRNRRRKKNKTRRNCKEDAYWNVYTSHYISIVS